MKLDFGLAIATIVACSVYLVLTQTDICFNYNENEAKYPWASSIISILSGLFVIVLWVLMEISRPTKEVSILPSENELRIKQVEAQKMSTFSQFVCRIAGTDPRILGRYFPFEISKSFTIGLAILLTGALAAISGGYALYGTFNNFGAAIIFGILWAIVIINIDRIMVMTISKSYPLWQQIILAIPRLILAVIIALVISKPLEVKILQTQILDEYHEIMEERADRIRNTVVDPLKKERNHLYAEKDSLLMSIKDRIYDQEEKDLKIAKEKVKIRQRENTNNMRALSLFTSSRKQIDEFYGHNKQKSDSMKEEIEFPKFEKNDPNPSSSSYDSDSSQRKADTNQILMLEREISKKDSAISIAENRASEIIKTYSDTTQYDFLTLCLALERKKEGLGNSDETINQEGDLIGYMSLFITLLFIMVELLPLISKLFSARGSYDMYIEAMRVQAEEKLFPDKSYVVVKT